MKPVLSVLFWLAAVAAFANDYVYNSAGTVLYQRYVVQEAYTWCGRTYYRPVYKYKEVVNYSKPDWRQQALSLIDKQKEREAFNQTLSYLGAQNIMASPAYGAAPGAGYGAPQQAAIHPSVTGNTVGGFTSYEYQRYGAVSAIDANKLAERSAMLIDNYDRTTADITRQNGEIRAGVGGLIQMNATQTGNAIELQETRAALREATNTVQQMFAGLSQFTQSVKPKDSEYLRYESGAVSGGTSQTAPQTNETAPPTPFQGHNGQPQPPPQQNAPVGDLGALNTKYCADCHGAGVNSPAGGFVFDPLGAGGLDETTIGALAMRLDDEAPDYRQDGKTPYRMPPVTYKNQPTLEERRAIVVGAKQAVPQP